MCHGASSPTAALPRTNEHAQEAERAAQIEVDKKEAAIAAEAKAKEDAPRLERDATDQRLVEQLTKLFESADEVDGPLASVISALQRWTGGAAVYVARKEAGEGEGGGDDGEDGEGGGGDAVRYIAASEDHQFMLANRLNSPGVTFDVWKLPEKPEGDEDAEEDEDGEEKKEAPPPPEYPVIHVPQVLHEKRMTFFKLPKLGAYLSVPVVYKSTVHDDAIKAEDVEAVLEAEAKYEAEDAEKAAAEAEAKAKAEAEAEAKAKEGADGEGDAEAAPPAEEDEEAKAEAEAAAKAAAEERAEALRPKIAQKEVFLAICLDTVGQNRDFTEEQKASAAAWGKALATALEAIEARQSLEEWNRLKAETVANKAALAEAAEKGEAEAAEAAKAAEAAVAELGADASEEDKKVAETNAKLSAAQLKINTMKSMIAEIKRRRIAPKGGAYTVLEAVLYQLGYDRKAIQDTHDKKKNLDWAKVRQCFNDDFFNRLSGYDPAEKKKIAGPYAKNDAVKGMLEGLEAAEINKSSVAIGALLEWVSAATAAKEAAIAKRTKEEEEAAAAAAAAEAEAKAKAEAEAEAAAAEAEGAGGDEGGDA